MSGQQVRKRRTQHKQLTDLLHNEVAKASELRRWLEKQECTFQPAKGGHLKVYLGRRGTILPMHGIGKDLGKGLVERIKKDLGLK